MDRPSIWPSDRWLSTRQGGSVCALLLERLTPPVRDREPAVPAEILRSDLRAWRILPSLVLGVIDQRDDTLDQLWRVSAGEQLGRAHVLFYIIVEHRVEHGVVRQRVAVELAGTQLRAWRLGDRVIRYRRVAARGDRLLVAPDRK